MTARDDVCAVLRRRARDHETEAARLYQLACDIENPPEGVRVEIGEEGASVRLVGPPVERLPEGVT